MNKRSLPSEAEEVPTGLQLCALDENYRRDPAAVMDVLRSEDPVHYDSVLKRFYLTRYNDIKTVLRNHETFSSDPRNALPEDFSQFIKTEKYEPAMPTLDDPDHRRLRSLVSRAFNPRSIGAMNGQMEEIADDLIDQFSNEDESDIIENFAAPMPTIVIANMLGVPAEEQLMFKAWSDELFMKFDPTKDKKATERMNAAEKELREYFRDAIKSRRGRLRQDLVSDLIRAEEEGSNLSEAEIVQMCIILLITGNVTTTDLIGNGVHALLNHPDQLALLRSDESLWPNAIEELLRYDTPVTDTGRIAAANVDIRDAKVPKGRSISTSLMAANHDPAVFDEPQQFDILRKGLPHQAFGGGAHTCLGAPLARLEGKIALRKLFERFPNMSLANIVAERRKLPGFRGFQTLVVRLR